MSDLREPDAALGDLAAGATENPFSASRVRPGTLEYRFPPGLDAGALLARFEALGGRGQIVGPHGSGKSTLLASLSAELVRRGRSTVLVTLHGGQRRMPRHFFTEVQRAPSQSVIIVDGYEQLDWWSRQRLSWLCRRRGFGLLITTHQPTRWPVVWTTPTDPDILVALATQLLGVHQALIPPAEVRQRLARHGGNVRELFMELYDRFEELDLRASGNGQ